ncbi:MAG TPA: zinc ribbon domain-containing protein [Anaerolineales bacterium]|nr:zinc ribbon domain-containing protein [Anaerolineales bacterium]
MPTYYEILSLSPTANPTEIHQAIDREYAKTRLLVTHHDPRIVNQANQALAILEQARATLLDPLQRGAYDAQIGGGLVGGIADPNVAASLGSFMTPPKIRPTGPAPTLPHPAQEAGWACPNCGAVNREGSRFCSRCRTQLADNCAICNSLVLQDEVYCPECGVDVVKGRELVSRWKQIQQDLRGTAGSLQQANKELPASEWRYKDARKIRWGWVTVGLGAAAAVFCAASGNSDPTIVLIEVLIGLGCFFIASPYARMDKVNRTQRDFAETSEQVQTLQTKIRNLDTANIAVERELDALKSGWRTTVSA